ncbi:MAG: hypothetical protein KDI48_09620 [Xanthomonadales bacterium]|nr:hypothetical protein [Xanthomonadales bacterium]
MAVSLADRRHQAFSDTGWFARTCREQFRSALGTPEQLLLRAAPSAILSNVVGADWLAVGDAAASYDSMTSAGITKGLDQGRQSGQALGRFLHSGLRDELSAYQDQVFADFSAYLRLHQQFYGAEPRFADQDFWRRRMALA